MSLLFSAVMEEKRDAKILVKDSMSPRGLDGPPS